MDHTENLIKETTNFEEKQTFPKSPAKSFNKVLIFVAFALLLFTGTVGVSVFAFTQLPNIVSNRIVKVVSEVETFHYDLTIESQVDTTEMIPIDLGFGFPDEGPMNTTVHAFGDVIVKNVNTESEFSSTIQIDSGFGETNHIATIDVVGVGEDVFAQIVNVPAVQEAGIVDVSSVIGTWVNLNPKNGVLGDSLRALEAQIESYYEETEEGEVEQITLREDLDEFLDEYSVLKNIKRVGREKIRGEKMTHYKADVDLNELSRVLEDASAYSAADKFDAALEDVSEITLDVWLDKTSMPRKFEINVSGENNIAITLELSTINKSLTITPPTEWVGVFEFMADAVSSVFDSLLVDTDGDGLPDLSEKEYGTDHDNPDSDGDGFSDGDEVFGGFNPNGQGKLLINGIDLSDYQGLVPTSVGTSLSDAQGEVSLVPRIR